MRGRDTAVTCDNCGRSVHRPKAVSFEKAINMSTNLHQGNDVKFFERRRVYYCISCAKHKGIFKKKAEQAARNAEKYNY
jgi:ribosomal protein S26